VFREKTAKYGPHDVGKTEYRGDEAREDGPNLRASHNRQNGISARRDPGASYAGDCAADDQDRARRSNS
jgi:hypothetical protein